MEEDRLRNLSFLIILAEERFHLSGLIQKKKIGFVRPGGG